MIGIILFAIFGVYIGVRFYKHNEEIRRETERRQKAMLAELKVNELIGEKND